MIKLKINQVVYINRLSKHGNCVSMKGKIESIYEHHILIQFQNYKESFTTVDFLYPNTYEILILEDGKLRKLDYRNTRRRCRVAYDK